MTRPGYASSHLSSGDIFTSTITTIMSVIQCIDSYLPKERLESMVYTHESLIQRLVVKGGCENERDKKLGMPGEGGPCPCLVGTRTLSIMIAEN